MTRIRLNLWLLGASLGLLTFASCEEEEENTTKEEDKIIESGYVVGLRATDGDASADYMVLVEDIMANDTITSTGQGVEQAGWSYYAGTTNQYFSLGYTLNECIGYEVVDGELAVDSKFIFERIDVISNTPDDNTLLGIGAPWGGGSYVCNFQIIDAEDVSVTKSVEHPIYESFYETDSGKIQMNAWPTDTYIQDGKLFVSFYPLHGTSWKTPLMDTAYVTVYSYPELEYIKTFKDDRTGPIGYYGGQPCLLEDESGNHYTVSSSSYMAGFTEISKPSGILKINAGETEFDEDYFFNVEEKYGVKILNAAYVANGKAVARVTSAATETSAAVQWAAFGNFDVCGLVIVDLEAQTLTNVANVPTHAGQYQTPYYIANGKAYMSIRAEDIAYVYEIDPETATSTKGAYIDGIELQGIFKYN